MTIKYSLYRKYIFSVAYFLSFLCLISCKKKEEIPPQNSIVNYVGAQSLPSYSQRTGDPSKGYQYLIYGDYVNSGIPYSAYTAVMGTSSDNLLNRTGESANVTYDYNVLDAPNGVKIVSANCLQCHAGKLNGNFIVGLGNSLADFSTDQSLNLPMLDGFMQLYYGQGSPEWEAYEPFRDALEVTGPNIVTKKAGVNPADKLAAVLAAHRNKDDLSWSSTPQLPIPSDVIPSDVPPWWILKKKNTMFYTAVGRKDFSRIMMASSILTLKDSSDARIVDDNFADVLSYINSIEAPAYPESINSSKSEIGKLIFEENCSFCHGTYGVNENYPNLFVDLETIQTDSLLSISNYAYNDFVDWYNDSWFAKGEYKAELEPGTGYVAPPLDGIWATAPYLHNGSVPDLWSLLKSSERPTYWRRQFDDTDYNFDKIGWNYTIESDPGGRYVYDVTIPGYGNKGHYFGDALNDFERIAVIEYLKTL